jgi:hypothetical protein
LDARPSWLGGPVWDGQPNSCTACGFNAMPYDLDQ